MPVPPPIAAGFGLEATVTLRVLGSVAPKLCGDTSPKLQRSSADAAASAFGDFSYGG